jgi:hypothetical protein
VPLDDPDPPVLVGGDLEGGAEGTTVRYTSSVAGFVAARRWDQSCLSATPLVQAQAAELDPSRGRRCGPGTGVGRAHRQRQRGSARQGGPPLVGCRSQTPCVG